MVSSQGEQRFILIKNGYSLFFSFFLPLLCICLDYSKKHVPGSLRTKTSVTPDALERIHERRTGIAFNADARKAADDSNESGKSGGWFKRKVTIAGT